MNNLIKKLILCQKFIRKYLIKKNINRLNNYKKLNKIEINTDINTEINIEKNRLEKPRRYSSDPL